MATENTNKLLIKIVYWKNPVYVNRLITSAHGITDRYWLQVTTVTELMICTTLMVKLAYILTNTV